MNPSNKKTNRANTGPTPALNFETTRVRELEKKVPRDLPEKVGVIMRISGRVEVEIELRQSTRKPTKVKLVLMGELPLPGTTLAMITALPMHLLRMLLERGTTVSSASPRGPWPS